ncbi:LamB/YcsF family protein [Herbidospora galbida]|uniref:5-oxoprolinase subunit A n=1 Tax=Herbidospora galbida TaxID=2575442 RepID=A0A4V5V0H6_9ACTN|nr:5-oxoprolinase subunit PxpA [Herbidospora galbida]TKK87103.1 LamB/YcsF family protein [Herbidospora galbida]
MRIDLNADLGEGFGAWTLGDDDALLEIVTSANVACGFHAGDPLTIRRVCEAAVARGVAIGAQVSYRDLAGFGRREMDVPAEELRAEILYQLAAVDGIARAVGGRVTYVKPHGALYNRVIWDAVQARAVVEAVTDYGPLPVLTLPGSAVHGLGAPTVAECFADRAYTPEGALVSRREPGSVLHDPGEVAARAVRMAREGVVTAVDGSQVRVEARSICVHGDTPGAVGLARAVRDALTGAGVAVEAFA